MFRIKKRLTHESLLYAILPGVTNKTRFPYMFNGNSGRAKNIKVGKIRDSETRY